MKKQKSGISLIVLVITIIVIIILAVAVILSIANNNPIENAKEARIKNDLKTIEEELTLKQASNYVDEHANNKTPSEITIDDLASAANYKDKLGITEDGKLYVKSNASEEERKVAKDLGIETKDPITFTKQGELVIGSEVTASNGEVFYIVGGDTVGAEISSTTEKIILLSKYNLKEENGTLKQDTSGESNECAFSGTNYWSSVEGIAYPYDDGKYPDLNDETKYGSGSPVIAKAKAYGDLLGATGRLMTYEEAVSLQATYSNILYGTNTEKGCLYYWLGSANSERLLWFVHGYGNALLYSSFDDVYYGARPVIKVSKSLIK